MKFKKGESRNQTTMFPATIEEYIPEEHLAKLVCTIVNLLNLEKILKNYSEVGQYPYDPRILLSILFYGYAIGLRSSRKLAQSCIDRLDFMYIAAKLKPSHKTISEFRKNNLENLSELFQEIILIAIKLGLTNIGKIKVSIDGSKIRANASCKVSKDEEGLKKLLSEVNEKVASIMTEAEEIDKKEDIENKESDIPKELQKLSTKKEKIEKAIKDLKAEKLSLTEDLIEKKKKSGKLEKLTKKEESKIEKKKINLTDSDANYMKEREGCIKTNYNGQISVEEGNQLILANDITKEANDKKQLIPMLEKTEENIKSKIEIAKADSGYLSGANLFEAASMNIAVIIDDPAKKRINNENYIYDKVNFKYDSATDNYTCPSGKSLEVKSEKDGKTIYKCNSCKDCSVKESCTKASNKIIKRDKNENLIEANRERLVSEEGKEEYKKRMHTVEPVFGNLKFNLGFRQFSVRGVKKVKGEFDLMCIVHNIKKIMTYCNKNDTNLKACMA